MVSFDDRTGENNTGAPRLVRREAGENPAARTPGRRPMASSCTRLMKNE